MRWVPHSVWRIAACGDFVEHALVAGEGFARSRPVEDNVREPEIACPTDRLGELVSRERRSLERVEHQVAVDFVRCPTCLGKRSVKALREVSDRPPPLLPIARPGCFAHESSSFDARVRAAGSQEVCSVCPRRDMGIDAAPDLSTVSEK